MLLEIVFFYFGGISEAAMGGGGAQRPVWHVNGLKKMGARSARPRTRGQNPLIPPLLESCGLFSERLLTLFPIKLSFFTPLS